MENENTVQAILEPANVPQLNQCNLINIRPNIQITTQFDKLAEALAKAQGEIGNLTRNKEGYNYKYADLDTVINCIKNSLSKYGLNIMQFAGDGENQHPGISLTTIITHSSGQMMVGTMTIPVVSSKNSNDAQAYGSAITYARRYAIMAMMNLAAEDDDAANAKEFKFKNKPKTTEEGQKTTETANKNKPQEQMQEQTVIKPGIQRAQPVTTPTAQPAAVANSNENQCSECGATITNTKVLDFAKRKFNRPLCYACQEKIKKSKAS